MGLIACICEGAAEEAVIEILLDADKLIFTRDEMLEGEPIRTRGAEKFQERYLRKGFSEKITVYRILDSRRERFALSKAYEPKVDVINVITAPEIEMLVIFAEGKFNEFKKSRASLKTGLKRQNRQSASDTRKADDARLYALLGGLTK